MNDSISQVAKMMNMSVHTLRFYEKKRLIKPVRDDYNNRIFYEKDIIRLKMITNFKMVGTPLCKIEKFFSFFGDEYESEKRERFLLNEKQRLDILIKNFQEGKDFIDKILDEYYLTEG